MSKRRMVGWEPLAVAFPNGGVTTPEPVAQPAQQDVQPVTVVVSEQAGADGPLQDPTIARRRMTGWQPLTVTSTSTPVPAVAPRPLVEPTTIAQPRGESPVAQAQPEPDDAPQSAAATDVIQDPAIPRRRMTGWAPLTVVRDAAVSVDPARAAVAPAPPTAAAPVAPSVVEPAVTTAPGTAASEPAAVVAPVTEDHPRRRMAGWQPLAVAHPGTTAPVVAAQAAPPVEAPPARRLKPPAAASPAPVATPTSATPKPSEPTPAASKKPLPKAAKVLIGLGVVALVAAGLVILAQWLRTLEPVAAFIKTYDGTPTHPDGVEAGIPGWVGWQHFFNFFFMVMVIRSGLLIRHQQRPEAYWTPKDRGFYSPLKQNTPQKVSIQQWIHQTLNVLWIINGLLFYVLVFSTGHWMRIVPTDWDIFPNIVSAGLQYLSLDWPAENAWMYYNALQVMTYFVTVFIAAPLAILTGLRLSTWWPQQDNGINRAFPLPAARTTHFVTMVYFILFIIVHLFLVVTTGFLTNLNMMFTARDASDWWGIGVFAIAVAVTVGVAWLLKPIFISPIAEKTGQVSTR